MKELPPNQQRHLQNLVGKVGLHGQFYKGIYYDHGTPQISKEKQAKIEEKLASHGVIFQYHEEPKVPQLIG